VTLGNMKCLQRHFNKAEGGEEDSGFQASKAAAGMDHRDHPAAVAEELMVVVYTMTKKMTYTVVKEIPM